MDLIKQLPSSCSQCSRLHQEGYCVTNLAIISNPLVRPGDCPLTLLQAHQVSVMLTNDQDVRDGLASVTSEYGLDGTDYTYEIIAMRKASV